MFTSIWEDIKREFNYGNMVTRIIIINVAVFVLVHLVALGFLIAAGGAHQGASMEVYSKITRPFSISSDWWYMLTHPWAIFTHMFLHYNVFHILWNMLFMYWFGRIVGDFIGNQRILPIYLLGGLMGAFIYFLAYNLLVPSTITGFGLGASAAVLAIVVAAGVISPDYIMRLFLFGDVKLKWIVAVVVFFTFVYEVAMKGNVGSGFAHLGGALMGFIFIQQLRSGNDLSAPVNNFFDTIISFFRNIGKDKKKKGPRVAYKNPNRPKQEHKEPATATARKKARSSKKGSRKSDYSGMSHQEQLDAILDKIKLSGYDSLSTEEREFLFNASKK